MDPYSSQLIANSHLDDLRAEGARSRDARSARRRHSGSSLRARLAAQAVAWRSRHDRRIETPATGQRHQQSSSRPA